MKKPTNSKKKLLDKFQADVFRVIQNPAPTKKLMLSIPLIIGVVLIVFGSKFILMAQQTKDWQKTEATVTKINLIETRSSSNSTTSKQTTFEVSVLYQYQVQGQHYQSEKYSYGDGTIIKSRLKNRTIAQQWLDNSPYQKGNKISVYYDPKDHKTAVIEVGANIWTFIPLIVGLFFTVIFGLILRNRMK
jgi:hypothetical protein